MSDTLLRVCFAGVGSIGALLGVGISSFFVGNDPSCTLSCALIGGFLGAVAAYAVSFVGIVVWFTMEVLR